MNTVELLNTTSIKPIYATIDLAEFNPAYTGQIRVRVNLTKAMKREMNAIQSGGGDADAEAALRLLARLIPRATDTDECLTYEELQQFMEGADETDDVFVGWFIERAFQSVTDYFLARAAQRHKSNTN